MKIGIIGGSGFIGRNLAQEIHKSGMEVIIYSRKKSLPVDLLDLPNMKLVTTSHPQAKDLEGIDVLVNLAGESVIGERWTESRKQALRQSRVDFTQTIVEELKKMKVRPKVFIQGSAIGYYGMYESSIPVCNEDSSPGEDFLAKLCLEWEAAALPAQELGIRTIILRTGVVLSTESGALQQMLTPFKMFVGGNLGTGNQFLSWIHIRDMVGGILFLIENSKAKGIFNFTSPNPCSNREFSNALGSVLSRPSYLPVPSFVINALFGEGAEVILKGQNVIPQRLQELKYSFKFPELKPALENLLTE
ncbi:MAG: TIGR01777 family protein [Leptospiraceae bacterium]|nr:TIGR01777 family protein [Leptospiraceae bacterium]